MDSLRRAGLVGLLTLTLFFSTRAQSLPFGLALTRRSAAVADTARVVPDAVVLRPASPSLLLVNPILPAGAATAHYGFFCKQELKWDKKLPAQLRFRMGSYEACDRLEGKRRD